APSSSSELTGIAFQ
ncbi:colicin release lysis protein, partial [Klebsiella pneumoniae]